MTDLDQQNPSPTPTPLTLNSLVFLAHNHALTKGFYDGAPERAPSQATVDFLLQRLMLIVTEVAEAAEEITSGAVFHLGTFRINVGESNKPEGFLVELADIMIRCADLVGWIGSRDFEAVVRAKMEYNATRPPKHGKLA